MPTEREKAQIIVLEHGFWEGVAPWYEAHMADNGVTIFPFGMFDKQQAMDSLGDKTTWASHEIEAPHFIGAGDDLVVLVYKGSGVRHDGSRYVAVISTTYMRSCDSWKLLVHQQSPES